MADARALPLLLHDKTRPSRIPPLGPEVAARVVALTLADPPVERAVLGLSLKCFESRGRPEKAPPDSRFNAIPQTAASAEGGRLAVRNACHSQDQRFAIALLSSVDERAEHCLDHGFDGRIIDALGLRQLGRDGFEIAIACRWRQRHRSLAHDRELAVGQAQNAIGFSKVHRGQIPVQA